MLWSNGVLIDYTVTTVQQYCTRHTVLVMLRMWTWIEQLWATLCTGLTASASPFLLLSPLINTLIAFCQVLRSEASHAGIQIRLGQEGHKTAIMYMIRCMYTHIRIYARMYRHARHTGCSRQLLGDDHQKQMRCTPEGKRSGTQLWWVDLLNWDLVEIPNQKEMVHDIEKWRSFIHHT